MNGATQAELDARGQAIINILVQQRNAALDQCAALAGEIAILEKRLAATTMPADAPVAAG